VIFQGQVQLLRTSMTFKKPNHSYKNTNFKEYYSVPKNATFTLKDICYKKIKIIEDNLSPTVNGTSLGSFEIVRADRVLFILDLLQYYTTRSELGGHDLAPGAQEWFHQYEKRLSAYLNNAIPQTSFYTPEEMFQYKVFSTVEYLSEKCDEISQEKKVGRLYGKKSLQFLPRELRYLLLAGEYIDYDIKNAHPSILLDYAEKKKLVLNGSLKYYIDERKLCLKEIENELPSEVKAELDKKEQSVKTHIIIHMNRTWIMKTTGSKLLDRLDRDFQTIREFMWKEYNNKAMPDFIKAVEGPQLTVARKKVRLTSLYCQTEESTHLFNIINFLRESYQDHLNIANKHNLLDHGLLVDKKVEISAIHGFSVIPFFDGFLVKTLDSQFNREIPKLVGSYNLLKDGKKYIEFVMKDIEKNYSYLDEVIVDKFKVVHSWLASSKSRRLVGKYFQESPEIQAVLKKQSYILRSDPLIIEKMGKLNNQIKYHFYQLLVENTMEVTEHIHVEQLINQKLTTKNKGATSV
jgi:hypothetical protein